MDGDTEPSELATLRQGFYKFFGAAFLPPDQERLSLLSASRLLLDDSADGFAFARSWRELGRQMLDLASHATLEEDYLRLLAVGTGSALCPPVESRWRAKRRAPLLIAGVEHEYREMGYVLAPTVLHTADHAATQLEAMAVLCHREAHAWAVEPARATSLLRREWSFLHDHLALWFPRFAGSVRELAGPGFYAALVGAADAFVQHDYELVHALSAARLGRAVR